MLASSGQFLMLSIFKSSICIPLAENTYPKNFILLAWKKHFLRLANKEFF